MRGSASGGRAGSALALVAALGCAVAMPVARGPLRLSELAVEGDDTRRASLHQVLEGLDADGRNDPRALDFYELAIRIDPTNPFAYLALARHYVERGDASRGIEYLDQAELLLESQGARSPRVEPHLAGLRGAALQAAGRAAEARPSLELARSLAPQVWSDGRLEARELR